MPGGFRVGGTAAYAAVAARRLGWRAAVLTSAGGELALASALEGVEVYSIEAPATTTFENLYSPHGRQQRVLSLASPLEGAHVPSEWVNCPLVLLGPVAGEVAPSLASAFPHALIGVSAQGWLRGWDAEGRVHPRRWDDAEEVLSRAAVLFLATEDVAGYEGVIEDYARQVPVMAVTEGVRGARVHSQGRWHHVPAFPAVAIDPTGAGDAFAAAFLLHYAAMKDALAAGVFACCVASFAVEGEGLEGLPSLGQVKGRMAEAATRGHSLCREVCEEELCLLKATMSAMSLTPPCQQ